MAQVRLQIVYDNHPGGADWKARWGFACLVTPPSGQCILFDTGGEADILLDNLATAGVTPSQLDGVVLSHSDWDHVGGVRALAERNPRLRVFVLSDLWRNAIQWVGADHEGEVICVRDPRALARGVYSTGPVASGRPEQAMIVRSGNGLVILVGCAHPGIEVVLETIRRQFPNERILAVVGGLHLKDAKPAEVIPVVKAFRQHAVLHPVLLHCSGDLARRMFRQEYGEDALNLVVGSQLAFG